MGVRVILATVRAQIDRVESISSDALASAFDEARASLLEMQVELDAINARIEKLGAGNITRHKLEEEAARLADAIFTQEKLVSSLTNRYRQLNDDAVAAIEGIGAAVEAGNGLWETYKQTIESIGGFFDAFREEAEDLDGPSKETEKYIAKLKEMNATFGLSAVELIRYQANQAKAAEKTEEGKAAIEEQAQALIKNTEELEAANEQLEIRAELEQKLGSELDKTIRSILGQAEANEKVRDTNAEFVQSLELELQLLKMSDAEREIELALRQLSAEATDVQREKVVEYIKAIQEQRAENERLAQQADPFAKAWVSAVNRMNDAFIDMWEQMLTDGEISLDSLKRIAIRAFAEIAHAATTQQILLNVGGTANGAAGAATSAAGGTGNLVGSFASLFTGGGSAAGGAGALSTAGTFALAAAPLLIGASTGDRTYGAIGGALSGAAYGAMVGSVVPVIGTIIGAILGALLADLADDPGKRIPRIDIVDNQLLEAGINPGQYGRESAFGVTIQGQQITEALGGEAATEILDTIQGFDQAFAQALAAVGLFGDDMQQRIKEALLGGPSGENHDLFEGDFGLEDILDSRFDRISTVFSDEVRQFAQDFGGSVEDDITALVTGAKLEELIANGVIEGFSLDGLGAFLADYQEEGETMLGTLERVMTVTGYVSAAFDAMGLNLDKTFTQMMEFSAGLIEAAGGAERAGALWDSYFANFYTQTERLQHQLDQVRAGAQVEFADIGLNLDDFQGETGRQAFRELFESLLPTLSAEATAEWLEAAAALGIVLDLESQLSGARQSSASAVVNDFLNQLDLESSGRDFASEMIALQHAIGDAILEAQALGASEEELTTIRASGAAAMQQLREQQALATQSYSDFMAAVREEAGLLTGTYTERQVAEAELERRYRDMVAQANELARQAGMAGASVEDLAAIQEWYAAQMRAIAGEYADLGYQTAELAMTGSNPRPQDPVRPVTNLPRTLTDLGSAASTAEDRLRTLIDALRNANFQDDLSGLSPYNVREQFDIEQAEYDRLLALAENGDQEAAAALIPLGRDLLELQSGITGFASGAFRDLYEQLQSDRLAVADFLEASITDPVSEITGPLADLRAELNAILAPLSLMATLTGEWRINAESASALLDLLNAYALETGTSLNAVAAQFLPVGISLADLQALLNPTGGNAPTPPFVPPIPPTGNGPNNTGDASGLAAFLLSLIGQQSAGGGGGGNAGGNASSAGAEEVADTNRILRALLNEARQANQISTRKERAITTREQ